MSGGSSESKGTAALEEGSPGGAASDSPEEAARISGVRLERGERETTPAPPDLSRASEAWSAFPSARPTSVPGYDVAAHAFGSSLRHVALPNLPMDVAVPTRTRLVPPVDLELRASFLLLHVDGRLSVREIAELTGLVVDEVLAAFLALTSLGLVELGGTSPAVAAPRSGERPTKPDIEE